MRLLWQNWKRSKVRMCSPQISPIDNHGAQMTLVRRYELYKKQTLQSAHDKTAKFYMMYVQFMNTI